MTRVGMAGAIAQAKKVIDAQASKLQKDFQEAVESYSARGFSSPSGLLAESFCEKATERLRTAGRSVHAALQASGLLSSLTQGEEAEVLQVTEEGLRSMAESYHSTLERYGLRSAKGQEVDTLLNSEILKLAELFKHR